MKLTIDRDLLLKAVKRCDLKAAPTGNAALACVALHAKRIPDMPGGLDLKATNGLVGVATMVACATQEEAAVAINCKQLAAAITTMPLGTLTLDTQRLSGGAVRLAVQGGKRRWQGLTRPVEDVRDLPEAPDSADRFTVSAKDFLALADRTEFAVRDVASDSAFRLGLFLDAADTLDTIVCGNHIVAHASMARSKPGDAFRALLTDVALPHVRAVAAESQGELLTISRAQSYVWVENSSTMIVFTLPPDDYLDWRRIIAATKTAPVCRIPRLALLDTLKAMLATATHREVQTWVRLLPSGEIRFDCHDPDGETVFHDSIHVQDVQTEQLPTFMVNAAYLHQIIDAAGSDIVLRYDLDSGQHVIVTTDDGFWCMLALVSPSADKVPPPLDGSSPPEPLPKKEPPPDDKPKRGGARKPAS